MCKIWKKSIISQTHTHASSVVRGHNPPYFFPHISEMPFQRQFSEVLPGTFLHVSFVYLFTAQCSFNVPSAHNHLVVLLAFSHFSIISVFLLTEAHLLLSEVGSQYFYLEWVLLWPRWLLRMSPLNLCLDGFEVCFVLLTVKTDYDQAFAQYFHSN